VLSCVITVGDNRRLDIFGRGFWFGGPSFGGPRFFGLFSGYSK
jgi:hypothetical protein